MVVKGWSIWIDLQGTHNAIRNSHNPISAEYWVLDPLVKRDCSYTRSIHMEIAAHIQSTWPFSPQSLLGLAKALITELFCYLCASSLGVPIIIAVLNKDKKIKKEIIHCQGRIWCNDLNNNVPYDFTSSFTMSPLWSPRMFCYWRIVAL